MIIKFLILINLCFIKGFDVSYEGYKVFKAVPRSDHEIMLLDNITKKLHADIWRRSRLPSFPWEINLPPNKINKFLKFLNETHIDSSVMIENLEDSIREEKDNFKHNSTRKNISCMRNSGKRSSISMDKYHTYKEIRAYMKKLVQLFPTKVQQITIGRTIENRPIEGIKLSSGHGTNKPAIFVEGGIHAREWISPAMCVFIMQQLLENHYYKSMLNKVNWYIFPVVNPDGYCYSINKNRMWRKNRSKNTYHCYGVDLNRNYDFHWGEIRQDANRCGETYRGSRSFSELETRSLGNFILKHRDEIKLQLAIHSHGGQILYPWAYSKTNFSADKLHFYVGRKAADAIKRVRGTKYSVGSTSRIIYLASGISQDWAFGYAGIPLSYTLELEGYGYHFDPPKSMINGIVYETFEGIKEFHSYVQSTWG